MWGRYVRLLYACVFGCIGLVGGGRRGGAGLLLEAVRCGGGWCEWEYLGNIDWVLRFGFVISREAMSGSEVCMGGWLNVFVFGDIYPSIFIMKVLELPVSGRKPEIQTLIRPLRRLVLSFDAAISGLGLLCSKANLFSTYSNSMRCHSA